MMAVKNNKKNNKKNFKNKPKVLEKVTSIVYHDTLTVKELADKINKNSSEIIKTLFMLGNMVTINSLLDDDTIELICSDYEIEVKKEIIIEEHDLENLQVEEDPKNLVTRPPVVTIMGHVDHGKTSLLDAIRKTRVTEGEFGGITQHIGAYQVSVKGQKVTFLDTPGHEAFTAMRSRGAQVTDIVIIVVAGDDGVKPQTKEAVEHAKAANVPVIVAINKIDKPGCNFDKVQSELANLDLMPEEWGGSTIFTKVSAKTGEGISDLLETILLVAEVEEFKANPKRSATGSVIEAKLDKTRGPVATLLVQNGTLKHGDSVVVGTSFGKVRRMDDDRGREIKQAAPSTPVEIIGLNSVPESGDFFMAFEDDRKARMIAEKRSQERIESQRNASSALTLDDLSKQIAQGELQEINVIVKADVQGSVEAVKASFEKLEVENVRVKVVSASVGAISESDVMLASASNALIYGFNVRPNTQVRDKANEVKVTIRLHNIIYKALEELETTMKGMLAPVFEEVVIGQAEVRQIYKVSKVGTIAGCMVIDGKIKKECKVRLIRDGIVVYTGQLSSLKRFQNDAKEVASGYDCGLTIANYNDIKENDVIEAYEDQEVSE